MVSFRSFGIQTGREVNKFENFSAVKRSCSGLYYLTENCNTMFSCKVVEKKNLGSHMMFAGEVAESKGLHRSVTDALK